MIELLAQAAENGVWWHDIVLGLLVGGGFSAPTIVTTVAVLKSQMKRLQADLERNRQYIIEIRKDQQEERLDVHERLVKLETLIIKNGNGKH